MKKSKRNLRFQILSVLLVLLFFDCNKKVDYDNDSNFIASAKKYYADVVVQKEKRTLSAPYSELPSYSNIRKFARMEKIGKRLQWNQAKEYTLNGSLYLAVPVEGNRKPFKNKSVQGARTIVFEQLNDGDIVMNVIEVVSKKNAELPSNVQDVSVKAYHNKQKNRNESIPGVSVLVNFYDNSYNRIKSLQIENGASVNSDSRLKNLNGRPNRRVTPTMMGRITCQTCQHWYLVGIWYNTTTGQVIDYEILDEWDECTEGTPPEGYGETPTPEPAEDCAAELSLVEGNATSQTENIEVVNVDATTRTINYHWKIYAVTSVFTTLYLVSHETGVHYKDCINCNFKWQSLTHNTNGQNNSGITKTGTNIGWGIDWNLINASPSINHTTQRATMFLEYNVETSLICRGAPWASTKDLNSTAEWHVNDL